MKRLFILLVVLLSACSGQETADTRKVQDQQAIYAQTQPIPAFQWSRDRDTLIQIYKAKNEANATWSVITSQGTGMPIYICPSIGFPLPADTQLTNGLQQLQGHSAGTIVEQAEPNGLFSSKNTDATYILCVRLDGSITPVYTEQKVTTFPYAVKIVNGVIVDAEGSGPSIKLDIKR